MAKYKILVRKDPHQVIWEIAKRDLAAISDVDHKLFAKAKNHMKGLVANGLIDHYLLEDSDLWQIPVKVKTDILAGLPDDYLFRFVLARGFKRYQGVEIERSVYSESGVDISIVAKPNVIKNWNQEIFQLNVNRLTIEAGCPLPDRGHVLLVLELAQRGKRIKYLPLLPASEIATNDSQGYSLSLAPHQDGILLTITNPRFLTSANMRKIFTDYILQEAKQLSKTYKVQLLKERIIKTLTRAAHGKQALGLGMPLTFFGGLCQPLAKKAQKAAATSKSAAVEATAPAVQPKVKTKPKAKTAAKTKAKEADVIAATSEAQAASAAIQNESQPPENTATPHPAAALPPIPENYPGKGRLDLNIAANKCSASICNFNESWYQESNAAYDETWLEREMIRHKLIPRQQDLIDRVTQALKRQAAINELQLCKAEEGTPPEEPYLHYIDPEADKIPAGQAGDQDSAVKDMRKSMIKTLKAGVVFCEWRFRKDGTNGRNIFGDTIPPPDVELPEIQLGEGAAKASEQSFKALIDGLPVVDNENRCVDVKKHYVTAGDINLTTGNIEFDGAVTVKGQVRDQAVITCTGDLIVEKGVGQATLKAGGNITVADGIVNADVLSRGDVTAGFIENSTIDAGRDLKAARSIMNSNIIARRLSCVGDPGLLAGGRTYCYERMVVTSIAFANNLTTIIMGVDARFARRVQRNDQRLARCEAYIAEREKELGTFKGKSPAQLTKAHRETIKDLKKALKRSQEIAKKIKERKMLLKIEPNEINESASIIITKELKDNAEIYLGEESVKITGGCAGVYIDPKKRHDSYIKALPEGYGIGDDLALQLPSEIAADGLQAKSGSPTLGSADAGDPSPSESPANPEANQEANPEKSNAKEAS